MTADEYRIVTDFENGLKIGDAVKILWTNCGNFWDTFGFVNKVNTKTINVTLTRAVGGEGGYTVGRVIQAPRITAIKRWSVNNRVAPIGGTKQGEAKCHAITGN